MNPCIHDPLLPFFLLFKDSQQMVTGWESLTAGAAHSVLAERRTFSLQQKRSLDFLGLTKKIETRVSSPPRRLFVLFVAHLLNQPNRGPQRALCPRVVNIPVVSVNVIVVNFHY